MISAVSVACKHATIAVQIVRTSDFPIRVDAGLDIGIDFESVGVGFGKVKCGVSSSKREDRVCSMQYSVLWVEVASFYAFTSKLTEYMMIFLYCWPWEHVQDSR